MDESLRYLELTNDQLRSLEAICTSFERSLSSNHPQSLEDHLAAAPTEIRDILFRELLAIELEWKTGCGVTPNRDDYFDRFPDRIDDIKVEFDLTSAGGKTAQAASRIAQETQQEHPQRVGRFVVDKLLGSGGFGRVYLARDENLDRAVAIKVPHAKHRRTCFRLAQRETTDCYSIRKASTQLLSVSQDRGRSNDTRMALIHRT